MLSDSSSVLPFTNGHKQYLHKFMNKNFSEDDDWEELIELINNDLLIPIIGNEMYKFKDNDKLISLDDYLSVQLFEKYKVTDQPNLTLYKAVGYLKNEKKEDPDEIDVSLKKIANKVDFDFVILTEFFTIQKLNYFINTSIHDKVLEKIITRVRKQEPVLSNFIVKGANENRDLKTLQSPFVFNVFGSLTNTADPVTSEEEMLEYTIAFMNKIKELPSIDTLLQNKNLLFIGCTYPDWLLRLILRLLPQQSFSAWKEGRKMIVINDKNDLRDIQFNFLKNYKIVTYEGNTNEFVQELAGRWNKKYPVQKIIFLSYTETDKAAVENLKTGLESIASVTCWYDKDMIGPGGKYDAIIAENIKKADLFIPLISFNSLSHITGYIRKEWNWAESENMERGKKSYVIPINIDSTKDTDAAIPGWLSELSIVKVPDGKPEEKFLMQVKEMLKL